MSLYKPAGTKNFWCRFRIRRREVRQSTFTDIRTDAEEYEERLRRRIWREIELGHRAWLWEDAVEAYTKDKTGLAEKTIYRNNAILAWFAEPLAKLPLLSITPEVIQAAREALQVKFSLGTANRYLAVLSAVLNHAVGRGMLKIAPKVPLFEIREVDPEFLTREQFDAVLAQLPTHLRPPVLFSVLTGLRMANVRDLVWGRVDIWRAHCWIPRSSSKGKRPISVPLPPEAVELLKRQPWIPDVDRVFTFEGRAISGGLNTKAYRAAFKRAGLGHLKRKWHILRHTWASWMAQDDAPTLVLKELGGWQSVRMAERYSHLSTNALRSWADRMKTGKG